MAMELNAVVKTTKILDFEYQLNTDTNNAKTFVNKTGKKLWFRYTIINPKNGDFAGQEPVLVPEGWIQIDFSKLGRQILPSGYGKVVMSLEVAKVTQTPDKKMDELCACRFKNGKKDLLINEHEFAENDQFELYLDCSGHLACKSVELVE
jgi:hypothetical protein